MADADLSRIVSKYGAKSNGNIYKHWNRISTEYKKPRKVKIPKLRSKPRRRIKLENKQSNWWLYVLELESGRYYVGISTNVDRRFKKHLKGGQALFTTQYKPLRIIYRQHLGVMTMSEASLIENKHAMKMVKEKGQEFVSGGSASILHVAFY